MVIGVIPARYASTRLPGKPLVDIGGKPMIQHVYERASESKYIDHLIVATDDQRIVDVVENFGGKVVLTPPELPSGSDRIAYVVKNMQDVEIIVNIQGDEPFINPIMIDMAIEPLAFDKNIYVSTLAKRISKVDELKDFSVVKVVMDMYNDALYFSRSPIPFVRDDSISLDEKIKKFKFLKHIGLYVYRKEALLEFTRMEQGIIEQHEKLEQLRFLENKIPIKVVETEYESISVDTPEDLKKARNYYQKLKKQQ
jgi:3-deoxy-manno-octulosonate cytidylyltransferase (CMP-KDO synthetase)